MVYQKRPLIATPSVKLRSRTNSSSGSIHYQTGRTSYKHKMIGKCIIHAKSKLKTKIFGL
jgi:hypothetical protein